jgi:hypothetical protein
VKYLTQTKEPAFIAPGASELELSRINRRGQDAVSARLLRQSHELDRVKQQR